MSQLPAGAASPRWSVGGAVAGTGTCVDRRAAAAAAPSSASRPPLALTGASRAVLADDLAWPAVSPQVLSCVEVVARASALTATTVAQSWKTCPAGTQAVP